MNRLILIFIVVLAGFFGGPYLVKSAVASPAPATDDKPADSDRSQANDQDDKRDLVAATPRPAQAPALALQKQKKRVSKKGSASSKRDELPDNPKDEDLAKLQGTWQILDAEHEGVNNAEEAKKYKWEFKGNKYTIKNNDKFAELWAVRLASSRNPKAIDAIFDVTGQRLMGIYELSGDTLKVCYDLTGRGRPDNFKAPKGSKRVVYTFQRR